MIEVRIDGTPEEDVVGWFERRYQDCYTDVIDGTSEEDVVV